MVIRVIRGTLPVGRPRVRAGSFPLGRRDLDLGVGERGGVAEVGERERVDRVDGGVALGVLASGPQRDHHHPGGDVVGDLGRGDELAAVVEHADIGTRA